MHRACAGKLYKLPWDTRGIQLYTYIPQFHCNPFRHVSQEQIERKNAQFFVLKAGTSQEKGCLSGGPLGGREAGKGRPGKEAGERRRGKGRQRRGRRRRGEREAREGDGKGRRGKGGGEGRQGREAGEGGGEGGRGKRRGKEVGERGGGRRRGKEAGKGGREGAGEGEGKERGRRRGQEPPHVGSQKKPRQKAFAARCEAFCRGVWCGAARLRPDAADVRKKRERSSATALPPP